MLRAFAHVDLGNPPVSGRPTYFAAHRTPGTANRRHGVQFRSATFEIDFTVGYSTPLARNAPAVPTTATTARNEFVKVLKALTIRNFALVAELDIEFGEGLTVITGESGAGKSILLDALSLVLGARLRRSALRPGTPGCDVSAEFDVGGYSHVRDALADLAVETADGATCLVRRTASERRSRAFVNGVPGTLATLQAVTEPLIDIHGQDEHRQLLKADVQRRLLDEFGVDAARLKAVAVSYRERVDLQRQLDETRRAVAQARDRKILLGYQIDELTELGDDIDRFDELTEAHKRLSRARELIASVGSATQELDEDLTGRVARLLDLLERTDDPHPRLRAAVDLGASAHAHLAEAAVELRGYLDSFPEDDSELEGIDDTLARLHDVARKHRVRAADLRQHFDELKGEFDALAVDEARVEELGERATAAQARFREVGEALSDARRKAGSAFAKAVTATFAELGLKDASLMVEFRPTESAAGLETVEFRVVTNPRYPAGTLADIASGGELARISLAIEVVAAERSRLPCLILDEADIGVGGVAADVLGRLLRRLSKSTQVIAITHAPQIAALGDAHLRVLKTSDQDTVIEVLGGADRTEELARMLGGRKVTDATRAYAQTLLAEAGGG